MKAQKGDRVLVRAGGAGVHFGTLLSRNGPDVELENSRRLWKWVGANTDENRPGSLHEVATGKINLSQSKISDPVEWIALPTGLEVIKIGPLSNLPK